MHQINSKTFAEMQRWNLCTGETISSAKWSSPKMTTQRLLMFSTTLRKIKIKPMQKILLIISKGVGLLQLSWVRRERGVAFLALSNSIRPTSQQGRGFSRKRRGAGRGRASISLSGSFCGRYVPGQDQDCVAAEHWDKSAHHRLEQPQSAPAPAPSRLLRGSWPRARALLGSVEWAAWLPYSSFETAAQVLFCPWLPLFPDWGEEGEREEPVRHAAFVLPGAMWWAAWGQMAFCLCLQNNAKPFLSPPCLSQKCFCLLGGEYPLVGRALSLWCPLLLILFCLLWVFQ